MASKSTNKTLWTMALIAVIGYMAYKLLPDLMKKLSDNGGGSGSNSVGGVQYYPPDYGEDQGQGQQNRNPLGFNFGGPGNTSGQGGAYGGGNILANFLNQVTGYNAQTMPYFNQQNADLDLQSQANDTIPLEAYQNLSDLPSWSPDDPNAPWNSDSNGSTLLETTDYTGPDSISGGDITGGSGGLVGGSGGSGGDNGGGGAAGDNNGDGYGS